MADHRQVVDGGPHLDLAVDGGPAVCCSGIDLLDVSALDPGVIGELDVMLVDLGFTRTGAWVTSSIVASAVVIPS